MADTQPRHCHCVTCQAERDKCTAWNQEQPPGRAHQKISEGPPTVPKCFQMRCVRGALIGIERNWHLCDSLVLPGGFDNHLSRELHSGTALIESFIHGFTETPQA